MIISNLNLKTGAYKRVSFLRWLLKVRHPPKVKEINYFPCKCRVKHFFIIPTIKVQRVEIELFNKGQLREEHYCVISKRLNFL